MSILTRNLTNSVKVNGKDIAVNMSFDNVLKLFKMLSDERLDDSTQIALGIKMLFKDPIDLPPKELVQVWEAAFKQLFIGEEKDEFERDIKGNIIRRRTEQNDSKKTFCFEQDANYIYASFMSDYGIDLNDMRGKLHWYKFKSLLDGLGDDTRIKKIIEIRTMSIPPKATAKERERIERLKREYALK